MIETEVEIRFFVSGKPVPGGSKRAFVNKKTGKASLVDMGKGNADWKSHVKQTAVKHYLGDPLDGPLYAEFHFVMPRPKKHFHTSKRRAGELRDDAPLYHTSSPDRTKLLRAAEDALKHVVWRDDCQVVSGPVTKVYGMRPGVEILVRRMGAS